MGWCSLDQLNQLPCPVIITDDRGYILVSNAELSALLGTVAKQSPNQLLDDLLPPSSRIFLQTHIRPMLLRDGCVREVFLQLSDSNGHSIPVMLNCRKGQFQGADVYYWIFFVALERSQFEASLLEERKRAQAVLRIAATAFESQQGMYITDPQRVILRVNAAFSEITGYTATEVIGQTPRLFSSGRHGAAFYDEMNSCLKELGSWRGEIWNRRKNGETYPQWLTISEVKDDFGVVTNYVAALTDITFRKVAEEEINQLVFYDTLTGLPNRRLLHDRLRHALANSSRSERYGALLFIDLDNFKDFNDNLGHETGDKLLQQVGQRLLTCVRETDTVARLGGDEFVVLLVDLSDNIEESASQAKTVGEQCLATISKPHLFDSYVYHGTSSIGVTLFIDQKGSIDELMKWADLAMYQAKAAGRNTMRFFDPEMQSVVTKRAVLEADLREAVLKGQFVLYYQPQMDEEERLTGAEVLVRWIHPLRGVLSPAEFIPMAEETGLILPLGQWVLDTACVQLAIWASQTEMAHLTIAVNVSARQFHQHDFVTQVLAVVERTGVNPKLLKLELTESMLVKDVEGTIAKMMELKAKGIGFSLDDFGTGYSSLSYLKRLPLEQLKIDQGFVRDILINTNDAAIAKMIIALGESMGLGVIAEGVEVEAQLELLSRLGCYAYQGYLFSRPLPLDEFYRFVRMV
jgi:diguanylate cyclase (GGDEF)-like protein/PAS domain S-box-containing protein